MRLSSSRHSRSRNRQPIQRAIKAAGIFVRSCQSNGDSVLGKAIILDGRLYSTAPALSVAPPLARLSWPRQFHRHYRKLALAPLRTFCSEGLPQELAVESLFLPFDGRILPETRLSDHASFWDAGLPALMVTDTAFFRNPNYHLPSDTLDTLDFTFMAQLVKSLELALLELPPAPNS